MQSGRSKVVDGGAVAGDEARAFQAPTAALASASLLVGKTWCMTKIRHRDTFDRLDSRALPRTYTWQQQSGFGQAIGCVVLDNADLMKQEREKRRQAGRQAARLKSKE